MTGAQAVAALEELTPNSYPLEQKLRWLQQVEAQLAGEVYFVQVPAVSADTALMAPAGYEEVYLRYLQAQIHLEAGEITRYNNAIALYNTALAALRRCHIRSSVSRDRPLTGF